MTPLMRPSKSESSRINMRGHIFDTPGGLFKIEITSTGAAFTIV